MAEHKSKSHFPYIAIVALVAVVAVVVLVMNFNSSDTSVVVDEEGNFVGEAARGFRTRMLAPSSSSTSERGLRIICSCDIVCKQDGTLEACACDTGCTCPGNEFCKASGTKALPK